MDADPTSEPEISAEEIEVLQATKVEIEALLGPCTITLFGSRARRDHRSGSDFDLLIVPEDDNQARPNATRIWDIEETVRASTGIAADLNLQLVPKSVLEDAYFEWPFLPRALADGIDINDILETAPSNRFGR
jgi:predicted nucleotidyltransferase